MGTHAEFIHLLDPKHSCPTRGATRGWPGRRTLGNSFPDPHFFTLQYEGAEEDGPPK